MSASNKLLRKIRKWHRWPGLIIGIFFMLWAISGIVMNHRSLISSYDISRGWMAGEYQYSNWNNGAVKSSVVVGEDSTLVYGNIGVWLGNNNLSSFSDFNTGFPEGTDNHKISSILVTSSGNLYAGTLFGLFHYDFYRNSWDKIHIPVHNERVNTIIEKDNRVWVLTRSELVVLADTPDNPQPEARMIPRPVDYNNKAGLFKTLWVMHSGEIYGGIGKLIIDLLGLKVVLLTLPGFIH